MQGQGSIRFDAGKAWARAAVGVAVGKSRQDKRNSLEQARLNNPGPRRAQAGEILASRVS